jgi:hypothetical protein
MTARRTLPFRVAEFAINGGGDPDVILHDDPDAIDESTEAVGDWPEIEERCPKAPAGQCEYIMADGYVRCIHCGRPSGVW